MAMNVYENKPNRFRIYNRFVKRPGETRNFKWNLMWSFNHRDEALAMLDNLRWEEGPNALEEYRLVDSFKATDSFLEKEGFRV